MRGRERVVFLENEINTELEIVRVTQKSITDD